MSKITTKIRKIWDRFHDKEYREEYLAAKISGGLAAQIFSLREQRGWTQYDLAAKANMKQPRISKLEESCENVSVNTLKKLASAFDVALSVEFVSFGKIVEHIISQRIDKPIPSFSNDVIPNENRLNFYASNYTPNKMITIVTTSLRDRNSAIIQSLFTQSALEEETYSYPASSLLEPTHSTENISARYN
jgi:transcriptional regulator with XRE-family HTH domain